MNAKIWKFIAGLLVLALLIGGGTMLYRAGYAQGAMADVSFETLSAGDGHHYGMRGYHGYHGHMGFFFFGRFFFGMLFFFLFFGAIFRLFGMRRCWGMHGMKHGGPPWMRHQKYGDEEAPEGNNQTKDDEPEA